MSRVRPRRSAVRERLDWGEWVTARHFTTAPIHGWFAFPHSFAKGLVHALIEEWGLTCEERILDPFVGAGTTVLAAKEKRVPARGYDLSPLAVLIGQAKTANYSVPRLETAWQRLARALDDPARDGPPTQYPELLRKALPGRLLATFDAVLSAITEAKMSRPERGFFRLALLSLLPTYSRAEANGGWLRWVAKRTNHRSLRRRFAQRVEKMIGDLRRVRLPRRRSWTVEQADARALPDDGSSYSAVITSPPYPNRHDYTRIFGVELMLAFLDSEEIKRLRYQTFHSHPEARPLRPTVHDYKAPAQLARAVQEIRRNSRDPRVPRMVDGYFLDMYLSLREVRRVCRPSAPIAVVVGNVQYCGVPIAVDCLTAQIGEQAGLVCNELRVVRYRGNSAQQMKRFGRQRSRETLVLFRCP